MIYGERMLSYINRVQKLEQILKSMDVNIGGMKASMAILNGLSLQLKNFVSSLDALEDDSFVFSWDVPKVVFYRMSNARIRARTTHLNQSYFLQIVIVFLQVGILFAIIANGEATWKIVGETNIYL